MLLMPPYEKCPMCGGMVPDWHREWHTQVEQQKILQGTAGMECPLCRGLVTHARWQTPLLAADPHVQVERVVREVEQAARWAFGQNGMRLEDYLRTVEGTPYAAFWTAAQVHQADQKARTNP